MTTVSFCSHGLCRLQDTQITLICFKAPGKKKHTKTVKAADYQVMNLCTRTAFLTNSGNTFDANTHTFRFKRRWKLVLSPSIQEIANCRVSSLINPLREFRVLFSLLFALPQLLFTKLSFSTFKFSDLNVLQFIKMMPTIILEMYLMWFKKHSPSSETPRESAENVIYDFFFPCVC